MFTFQASRPDDSLLGDSPAIRRVIDQLKRAALTDVPVLITGETGTGKELAANMLHCASGRRDRNFFKVSCLAITNQMLAGKPFLDEEGSSAGMISSASGKFSQADKGTLFLDDVGELDLALQPIFLCALQNCQEARPGVVERPINIRLICATHHDLETEISGGRFRVDLFHRINVVRIHMPTLRERASDIPLLMDHFVRKYTSPLGRQPLPLSSFFMKALSTYHWPGNVRELENMAKRYVVLGEEEQALSAIRQSEDLNPSLPMPFDLTTPLRVQTKRALQHLEKTIILRVLEAHRWNRRKTARSLDISYRALLYKIKEVGLPTSSPTSSAMAPSSVHIPGGYT